ncbi:MAG: aminodeoxychorismate synthase component I [Flavobacterium sp. MedPE-SWcel]|uniref:anthranilate synthase component I family protein n=1 Tax=uncultured Flavobacterium sp. TaxID=165435 RepID=UPI0009116180|nr:anthranilate synthase component I family protein [uncultured Flavobacterium sp.]OIQ18040.1 MAG: aminodeoxychorismate synthase component I [Flavobacterium sp. MedPE-SWcel]
MRTSIFHTIQNPEYFKKQLLQWAQQFREVVFLDSNDYRREYNTYDAVLAVDALTAIQTDHHNAFDELNNYQQITKDWIFGYLSYDLKNDTEKLQSANLDRLEFPELFFFQPKKLFLLRGDQLEIAYLNMCDDEVDEDINEIMNCELISSDSATTNSRKVNQKVSKAEYIDRVEQMLAHIQRGDIYEANFCMEFYTEDTTLDTLEAYEKLNTISNPPFATYFKNNKNYLLSASPERYLKKEGDTIISQPIKGTARRSNDPKEDEEIRQELTVNEKERSENIMIVDLVRNDLSRTATKGSVQVKELCGAYSFKQVHHLVSTIESQLKDEYTPVDVIKTTFPMGSMTGAPKISAMEIIEKLEVTKRGLYSGAVGYFTPNGNFDFNVVIRSILYNQDNQYASFSVGSAITSKSTAEKEYEECLLKANAMRSVLEA